MKQGRENISASFVKKLSLDSVAFFLAVMQAGFAFLEVGAVRSKNTTNILLKNFLDACKYKWLITC